jgi:GxxExxY protein
MAPISESVLTVEDPKEIYGLNDLLYKEEVYSFIACCYEVHKNLGKGFLEAVYKDALSYELKQKNIPFEKEKKFQIKYKEVILPHHYYCDFIIHDKIIVEIKAQQNVINEHYKQLINYLAVSNNKLGLLVNFGEESLKFKRVIL